MKIDVEFQSLIPPLTFEEKKMLEESILNEGCRDAIVCGMIISMALSKT